jgi:hypothetical protein
MRRFILFDDVKEGGESFADHENKAGTNDQCSEFHIRAIVPFHL